MQSLIFKHTAAQRTLTLARPMVAMMNQPMMCFAAKGPLNEKEKGDEKQFFNKEDEKLLKNLLKKVQTVSKASAEGTEKSQDALKKLFKEHKISEDNEEFFNALLEWRTKP